MATVRTVGNVQVIELTGEIAIGKTSLARPLDLHGRKLEDVGDVLKRLLGVGEARIVLDLRRVNFIDSSGIGDLVSWKKRALERKGDIKLVIGPGAVRRILDLLRLDRVFETFDDETSAVESF